MSLAATSPSRWAKQTISSLIENPRPTFRLIDVLAHRVGEKRLYRFAPSPASAGALSKRVGQPPPYRRRRPDHSGPARLLRTRNR